MADREVTTPEREQDVALMRRALELAAQGPLGDPNPRVGAVIVDSAGRVVGEGFHAGAGTPHAEVIALRQAGSSARAGTAVVTLEPCSHTGRTGPCAQALIDAGLSRVVFAQTDPTASAHGGAKLLEAAGIRTAAGVLADESALLNDAWTFSVTRGRPKVTWKFAATLDGRSAAADGSSRWITGPAARADVHLLRARCDAILVGTGTVIADDPSLTVRAPDGTTAGRQPLRVVMGLRPISETARVRDDAAPTLLLATRDPAQALKTLDEQEIHHVWLEGGPTVAAAFVGAGLVDEVIAYLAPALLGAGPPALGDLGIRTMDQALRLIPHEVTTIGPDIRVRATIATPNREGRAMFTGIVEELGEIVAVEHGAQSAVIRVRGPMVTSDATPGASIAVNGVCLTVVEHDGQTFSVDVMAETLSRSSLGSLQAGAVVNLERAMPASSRFGGHIVQGHVDGTAQILSRVPGDRWEVVQLSLPPELSRYVVEKGSITVDGVSLTVSAISDDTFSVSLIPTTLGLTTLGHKTVGDLVNLEVDVIAKYVERLLTHPMTNAEPTV